MFSTKKIAACALALCLMSGASIQAQINLGYFQSRSARIGAYQVVTAVDSLFIDTRVNAGLASTRITMVVEPTNYFGNYNGWDKVGKPIDSIEMTLSFTLPQDFVADSMWLWVNGKPVEASIQDRTLAASQYQQIVGVRRDPALLQYSGGGYYFLRIFPASSNVPRKIALQFHHTFDDDSTAAVGGTSLCTALLPVVYDSAQVAYYNSNTYNYWVTKTVKYARLTCMAEDSKNYSVTMAGLGGGVFWRSNSLVIEAGNVGRLQKGSVVTQDPSGTGDEYLWTGRDLRTPSQLSAGFTTKLSENGLTFQPEPATRIIVIDVGRAAWNWNDYYGLKSSAVGDLYYPSSGYSSVDIWGRARKYALLALESFVNSSQSFNVIFSGPAAHGVFSSPVRGTAAHKKAAVEAILHAAPDSGAGTLAALQKAAQQASKGVVILISDLYLPYYYYSSFSSRQPTAQGIEYDSTIARINSLLQSDPLLTLFTISDNWQLSQAAALSGGCAIGGLRNSFAIPYSYVVVNGRRMMNLYLNPLFGSANASGYARVAVSSRDCSEIVFTLEGCNVYQPYYSTVFVDRQVTPVLMKTASSGLSKTLTVPVPADQSGIVLRAAGRASGAAAGRSMRFVLSGKIGGLAFSREITAVPDNISLPQRPALDVQWAFRKTEQLAADNWLANAQTIKLTGKEYHIVTRQTSLLALEPGMSLWADTMVQSSNSGLTVPTTASSNLMTVRVASDAATMTAGGAPASYVTNGTGFSIDSIPLSSLANPGSSPVIYVKEPVKASSGAVTLAGSSIILQPWAGGAVSAVLYDLAGRRIAARTFNAAAQPLAWDLRTEKSAAPGRYVLRITCGGYDRTFRIFMNAR